MTRGLLVEQLDHPLGAGERPEEAVRERAELADRPVELGQIGDEDEHPAERQRAVGDGGGAEARARTITPASSIRSTSGREQAVDPGGGELGLDDALVLAPESGASVGGISAQMAKMIYDHFHEGGR